MLRVRVQNLAEPLWYVNFSGGVTGPISTKLLLLMVDQGMITDDILAATAPDGEFVRVADIEIVDVSPKGPMEILRMGSGVLWFAQWALIWAFIFTFGIVYILAKGVWIGVAALWRRWQSPGESKRED